MKSFTTSLLAVLLLASGSSALAKITKRTYAGSYKGMACTVEMNWHNWEGLGAIDGVILVADGTTLPFSGSNSRPGVIEFKANGNSFRLVRRDVGRTISWVSSKLSFTEAAPAPPPTPTPAPTPTPTPQNSGKQYRGTYKGEPCTVELVWQQGNVTGTLALASGKKLPISGEAPGDGVLRVRVEGDEQMHALKVRAGGNGEPSFTGDSLAFTEVSGATTAAAVPPPTPAIPEPRMIEQTYTGSWRGKQFTARVRWAPGDNPGIIRRGRGILTLDSGQKFSIEGWQPGEDAAEFSITPDETGETYKTSKAIRSGKAAWESDSLILMETQ